MFIRGTAKRTDTPMFQVVLIPFFWRGVSFLCGILLAGCGENGNCLYRVYQRVGRISM